MAKTVLCAALMRTICLPSLMQRRAQSGLVALNVPTEARPKAHWESETHPMEVSSPAKAADATRIIRRNHFIVESLSRHSNHNLLFSFKNDTRYTHYPGSALGKVFYSKAPPQRSAIRPEIAQIALRSECQRTVRGLLPTQPSAQRSFLPIMQSTFS